jgi:phenylacetate-CoA ligase
MSSHAPAGAPVISRSPRGRPHRLASDALYAGAYDTLLFPVWQRIVRRRPIGSHRHRLERTQWLGRDGLDRIQVESLRALLDHAGRRVPYWRDLFRRLRFDPRNVRALGDLAELPVLTRETVRERFDDLLDPSLAETNIRKGTSGSSGAPLSFQYCNQSEAWRQAVRLRGYGWGGYRMGLPTVHYWGAGASVPEGWSAGKVRIERALRRETYVDAVFQDEASLRAAADVFSRVRPRCVIAYTQALASFARWAIDRGVRDWPDAHVLCAAEALHPHDRAAIERAFGPDVFETYGSRETMLVAAECSAHDGMHLSEENLVVEITREGRPLPAGQPGDVLVTDLHNYGMPFIRYANGDEATMAPEEPCACGRALRKLARVDGRCMSTMRDANGDPVPGMLFISLLASETEMIRAYQGIQRSDGAVELRVVRGREWNEQRFATTVGRLRAYFKGLPFAVTYCEQIPASKSGKRSPLVVEPPRS